MSKKSWFYYHLARDPEFQAEAKNLKHDLASNTNNGEVSSMLLVDISNHAQDGQALVSRAKQFMKKWNISNDYDLFNYLLSGDVNPKLESRPGIVIIPDFENKMLEVQLPLAVRYEDIKSLWDRIVNIQSVAGVDMSKRPRKKFTEHETKIAYEMWKMRRDGVSWTVIVKSFNSRNDHKIFDIKSAQRLLSSNGYKI